MQDLLGVVAVVMTVVAHSYYVVDIVRGRSKPHGFSWLVWGFLAMIVAISQVLNGGGAGAWPTFAVAGVSLVIAGLAIPYGTKNMLRSDSFYLLVAVLVIPVWLVTDSALVAVILVSLIDIFAFIPTLRKTFRHPSEETIVLYAINTVRHCLSILALSSLSLENYLYPASLVAGNLFMTVLLYHKSHRRSVLAR